MDVFFGVKFFDTGIIQKISTWLHHRARANHLMGEYPVRKIHILIVALSVVLILIGQHIAAQGERVLKVGVLKSAPPYAFIHPKTRVARGFAVDLAILLSHEMKTEIEFYAMDDWCLINELKKGKLDFISGLMIPPGSEPGISLIQTGIKIEGKLFVNTANVTITCDRDLPGTIMALEKERDISNIVADTSSIQFSYTDSHLESLLQVNENKAQVYISDNRLTSLYFIQKNRLENIKEVGMPLGSAPLALAVRADNTELLSNISLAMGKVYEKESLSTIKEKWFGHNIEVIEWEIFREIFLKVMLGVGSVIVLVLLWTFSLKKKVNQVTADLKQSEEKYRDLIESSPEMIHLISTEGSIKLANKNAYKTLGFDERRMLRFNFADLVIQEQRDEAKQFVHSVFEKGFNHKEFVFRDDADCKIPMEVVATTISQNKQSQPQACCFSRDLTERKFLEEGLLQTERLATMGRMASGIAHEINNPLGIILANAEDIMDNNLANDSLREGLESIERNAIRAGKIVENLLTITRPKPIRMETFDLHNTITESLEFLVQKLKKRHIEVKKQFCNLPLKLNGDKNLFQHLLLNLIINSIEAIEDKGVITIHTEVVEKNGSKSVRLDVEDTGIGIPAEDIPKLFDPFFTARKQKGFGLGLFIAQQAANIHRGTISVKNRKEKGTIMTVELPVSQ